MGIVYGKVTALNKKNLTYWQSLILRQAGFAAGQYHMRPISHEADFTQLSFVHLQRNIGIRVQIQFNIASLSRELSRSSL
jgi:hypothetical protein